MNYVTINVNVNVKLLEYLGVYVKCSVNVDVLMAGYVKYGQYVVSASLDLHNLYQENLRKLPHLCSS